MSLALTLEFLRNVDMAIPVLHRDQRPFEFIMQETLHLIKLYRSTPLYRGGLFDTILFWKGLICPLVLLL